MNILSDEIKSSVTLRVNKDISQTIQSFLIKMIYRHTHTHTHSRIYTYGRQVKCIQGFDGDT
jgi:hypothetical protein